MCIILGNIEPICSQINKQVKNHKHMGSISPMFYEQLLCLQITKAQKDTDDTVCLVVPLGSVHVKTASKPLVKLTLIYQQRCQGFRPKAKLFFIIIQRRLDYRMTDNFRGLKGRIFYSSWLKKNKTIIRVQGMQKQMR